MNRRELDELVAHYQLPPPEVERVLALAHAKPTSQETTTFAGRALLLAGVLSLAAGVVFLVAANWSAIRIIGRFVLLEALLVFTLALAYWKPPPRPLGQHALLGAFMVAGALLALLGQTYQTGANVYELFLAWTMLGLPLVIAGQSPPLWAAWILVLNLALGLFCGLRPETGAFWMLFDSLWHTPSLLLIAMLVNLALWAFAELVHARIVNMTGFVPLATRSLRRLLITSALVFATWSGALAIFDFDYPMQKDDWSVVWVFMTLAATGVYTWRRRTDVFPLALIAASTILLVMFVILENAGHTDTRFMATTLTVAVWLIVSSSLAARVILNLMRRWRAGERPHE